MITLLGISMIDLNGYDRLTSMLNKLEPHCVATFMTKNDHIEQMLDLKHILNEDGNTSIIKYFKNEHPNSNDVTLEKFLSINSIYYYINGVEDYCTKNDTPILFCDDPKRATKDLDEEYSKNTMKDFNNEMDKVLNLSIDDAISYVEKEYYAKGSHPSTRNKIEEYLNKSADRQSEKVLREASGNIVYVSPLDNVFGEYSPNLFDRLSDLNPRRIKLNDKI